MTSIEGCSLSLPYTERAGSASDLAALVETYSATLFRVAHSVLRKLKNQSCGKPCLKERASSPPAPLVLGSFDIPGSTRHQDVEVVMEFVK